MPFNRHFYVFKPPRPLAEIDVELKGVTDRIVADDRGAVAMSGIVPRGELPAERGALLGELRALIRGARQRGAQAANSALTLTYWRLGKRLLAEVLADGRGAYGRQILASASQELEAEFGTGFSYSVLTRMVRFAELFPDEAIVVSLIQPLTWTHFLALLPVKDPLAREFYAEMCRAERWSVRTLRGRIAGMLYERTALSRSSEEVVRRELAGHGELVLRGASALTV